MASNRYASYDTLLYFWSKLKLLFADKVDKESGKGLSTNDFTTAQKNKLSAIESNAEANQNAFSNVQIGNSTLTAASDTDTLELIAGNSISLTPNTSDNSIMISALSSVASVAGKTGIVTLDKTDVGISDLTQNEATTGTGSEGKLISAGVLHNTIAGFGGVANGFAPLNASSKIDSTYLPSYVDDVVEVYAVGNTPLAADWFSTTANGTAFTPETGKIYILMADAGTYPQDSQFRWGGSTYIKMADSGVSPITNAEIDTILAT